MEPVRATSAQVFDDELRISGEVCLSPPSDASFPVKVLFLVDTSDSMSVTDRSAMRTKAVGKVLERYRGHPGVKFGVIAFDSRIDRLTQGFTDQPDMSAIGSRLSSSDRLTDYQGALGAAYQMISEDIVSSSPAERARSKYVVVFFSDGAPDPQCSSRVTPCGGGECPAHQHCRAGVCKDDYLICTVPRREWESAFSPPIPPEMYPELGQGADYNQPSQILRAVDDILGLQDFYRVGEIRLHTGFLYDPEAANDPLAIPFGLDRAGGVDLMTAMAEHGMGTFTEFTNAANIDFLSINYTSFKEENDMAMLMATNLNVIDTGAGLKADSDRDGWIDDDEVGKTCVASPYLSDPNTGCPVPSPTCTDALDSDGDGYTDFFEQKNHISGFDPLDPNKPLIPCGSKTDLDGDLLRDCEEDFLKTDFRSTDTDGDRIPDGVEFRLGMDPLDATDAFADPDRDGERNLDEVKAHTNPSVAVSASHPVVRTLYDVVPLTRKDGKKCYQYDVRHIKLVTTGKGANVHTMGINRVAVYFDQVAMGRATDLGVVSTACVEVRYLEGKVKSPSDGWVRLQESDFSLAGRKVNLLEQDLNLTAIQKDERQCGYDPAKHCVDHVADSPDAGANSGPQGGTP